MNIYEARKLQKELYKRAEVNHKYMLSVIMDGELCYHNVAMISDGVYRTIDRDFSETISENMKTDDLVTLIFYNPGSYRNWPPGMYLAEIIKID